MCGARRIEGKEKMFFFFFNKCGIEEIIIWVFYVTFFFLLYSFFLYISIACNYRYNYQCIDNYCYWDESFAEWIRRLLKNCWIFRRLWYVTVLCYLFPLFVENLLSNNIHTFKWRNDLNINDIILLLRNYDTYWTIFEMQP